MVDDGAQARERGKADVVAARLIHIWTHPVCKAQRVVGEEEVAVIYPACDWAMVCPRP